MSVITLFKFWGELYPNNYAEKVKAKLKTTKELGFILRFVSTKDGS